jgi:hypothetical protein
VEPIHIFFLIIGLSGRPEGVVRSTETFTDVKVCEAAMQDAMVALQTKIDANPNLSGKFAVADVICKTNREMGGEIERGA